MKIVTANRLADGRVVYLDADKQWAEDISLSAIFEEEEAQSALAEAAVRSGEIADIYLIDANHDAQPAGRTALRETIRATGPTVREDLGKQSGNG